MLACPRAGQRSRDEKPSGPGATLAAGPTPTIGWSVRVASIVSLVALAGCAGDPVPVSRAPDDPSNPRAAEVPYVLPSSTPVPAAVATSAEAGAKSQDPHHLAGMPGMP
jgi:hypothetical protein